MSEWIILSPSEMLIGAQLGCMRQIRGIKKELTPNAQAAKIADKHWDMHIEGALAELALSIHLKRPWNIDQGPGGPDLLGAEARVTDRHDGCLIIRPTDDLNRKYWLLTGRHGKYCARGWLLGSMAEERGAVFEGNNRPPCWMVPQEKLLTLEDWSD